MTLMANAENLATSTAQMRGKADEAAQYSKEIEECFGRINSHVVKLQEYWIGDAANTYADMYRRQIEIANTKLERLKANIKKLYEVAGIYERTEVEVAGAADEIGGAVID